MELLTSFMLSHVIDDATNWNRQSLGYSSNMLWNSYEKNKICDIIQKTFNAIENRIRNTMSVFKYPITV